MSNDHQDPLGFPPPTTTNELHRKPSSPTTSTKTSTTPESLMAAALGRAIANIAYTSFQDALTATTTTTTTNNPLIRTLSSTGSSTYQDLFTTNNPLIRMLSDANSSANQNLSTTTATPPKVPTLHRAVSDAFKVDYQQQPQITIRKKKPLCQALSDASEYQQPLQNTRILPPRVFLSPTASPESSIGKRSPHLERMKKIKDMVKNIEQKCLDIIHQDDRVEDDIPCSISPQPRIQEQEECVGVERLKNGDLKFDLSCSCRKRFEMLIKNNGYCFYRLT